MKIQFHSTHKSIKSLETAETPTDFVVITGVNGAGKTHLLEAISQGRVSVEGVNRKNDSIKLYHHTGIVPKKTSKAEPTQLWNQRDQLWVEYRGHLTSAMTAVHHALLQQGIASEALIDIDAVVTWNEDDIRELVGNDPQAVKTFGVLTAALVKARRDALEPWRRNASRQGLLKELQKKFADPLQITEQQFKEWMPVDINITDVFQQNFAPRFASYHRLREENKINQYYAEKEGHDVAWLSEQEFERQYKKPPWDVVNRILETARLPLRVNKPEGRFDQAFQLTLRHTESDIDVDYNDLSSGEKVIISLAHCLYYVSEGDSTFGLPKLLLLDEPDAPLHPTMARSLMDVVGQVFVGECGIKVIMTTHSPSTLAYAPEESIYRLTVSPRRLVHCDKDTAVSLLTEGFGAIMPSTRFVIVEAQADKDAYRRIFSVIQQHESWQNLAPLTFLQASDQKNQTGGGCPQVSNWAAKLTEAGLPIFRGLIDLDDGNEPTEIVQVIGRYSIENYLLDPLIVYACMLERDAHGDILTLDEIKDCNVHKLEDLPSEKLQAIADATCSYLESKSDKLNKEDTLEIKYRNGMNINAPTWLRDTQGHELSTIVRHNCLSGEKHVITKQLEEPLVMLTAKLPGFISIDLEEVFVTLAK